MTKETLAKLQSLATDPNESDAVRKAAQQRLDGHARHKTTLVEQQRKATYSQRANVVRYRVNGVWKLDQRIADFDAEGDVVNGWSDKV